MVPLFWANLKGNQNIGNQRRQPSKFTKKAGQCVNIDVIDIFSTYLAQCLKQWCLQKKKNYDRKILQKSIVAKW